MINLNLKHFSNAFFFANSGVKENFSFFLLLKSDLCFFTDTYSKSFNLEYSAYLNFFFNKVFKNYFIEKKKIFQFFNSQSTMLELVSSLVAIWKKNLKLFFIAPSNSNQTELYNDQLDFFFFKNFIKKKIAPEKYEFSFSPFYTTHEKITTGLKFDKKKNLIIQKNAKFFFQNLESVSIKPNVYISTIFSKQTNFFLKKKNLITVEYALQVNSGDITEGLPKIEQLLSGFKKKDQAFLCKRNGVFFKNIKDQYFYVLSSFPKLFPLIKLKSFVFKKFLHEKKSVLDKIELDGTLKYLCFGSKAFIKNVLFFQKGLNYFCNKKIRLTICALNKPNLFFFENFFTFPSFFSKKFLYDNLVKSIQFFFKSKNKNYYLFEEINSIASYNTLNYCFFKHSGNFINIGEPISFGQFALKTFLKAIFYYHSGIAYEYKSFYPSILKFRCMFLAALQLSYSSQGVNIGISHLELISKQLTQKCKIKAKSHLLAEWFLFEELSLPLAIEVSKLFETNLKYYDTILIPKFKNLTSAVSSKKGFLSSAVFQNTKKVLAKSALLGSKDFLTGIKESIVTNKLLPLGSTFSNYKHYLDLVYKFKTNYDK